MNTKNLQRINEIILYTSMIIGIISNIYSQNYVAVFLWLLIGGWATLYFISSKWYRKTIEEYRNIADRSIDLTNRTIDLNNGLIQRIKIMNGELDLKVKE